MQLQEQPAVAATALGSTGSGGGRQPLTTFAARPTPSGLTTLACPGPWTIINAGAPVAIRVAVSCVEGSDIHMVQARERRAMVLSGLQKTATRCSLRDSTISEATRTKLRIGSGYWDRRLSWSMMNLACSKSEVSGILMSMPPKARRLSRYLTQVAPVARNIDWATCQTGRSRIKISIKETPSCESWRTAKLVEAT